MKDKTEKSYNLYVMRAHYQVRAKQKMLGSDWYTDKVKASLTLYKQQECPNPVEPEIKNTEMYEIYLDETCPNLRDLYTKIQEVCPEFENKRSFYLYWKYSSTSILPISNYITYLSMVSLIANTNNNLYLIDREWDRTWLENTAATYVAVPEDFVLVNMVAPKQSVYTATQENHLRIVESAGRTEFTRTYNPPARENKEKQGKEKTGKKVQDGSQSPKSKSANSKGTKNK